MAAPSYSGPSPISIRILFLAMIRLEKPRFWKMFKVLVYKETKHKITTQEEHPMQHSPYHIILYKLIITKLTNED